MDLGFSVASENEPGLPGSNAGALQPDAPNMEQFLILAQKVEELESRVRSLAVNDVDRVSTMAEANEAAIDRLKSPRYWVAGVWRRFRRAIGFK